MTGDKKGYAAVRTPGGPSWCDRATQQHDICETREQHLSKWQRCVTRTELALIRARLGQIEPSEADPIVFTELEIVEEGETRSLLILMNSTRIMAGALRRLVELDRRERAK